MADAISTTFAALADPTRRAILARLALGETSVTELAEPFEMSMPAVSKHLRVLENAGLIQRGREAQWRPCRLNAEPMRQAADWLEEYRQFWERASTGWRSICNGCRARRRTSRKTTQGSRSKGNGSERQAGSSMPRQAAMRWKFHRQQWPKRSIVVSRVFKAPRAMVWAAVTDPWQVGQWWGPKGFTTTMSEMNVRPGGKWKLVMHGPDGPNYPNEMTFTEVVRRSGSRWT